MLSEDNPNLTGLVLVQGRSTASAEAATAARLRIAVVLAFSTQKLDSGSRVVSPLSLICNNFLQALASTPVSINTIVMEMHLKRGC